MNEWHDMKGFLNVVMNEQQEQQGKKAAPKLIFGIYPLSIVGTLNGIAEGPPDDLEQTLELLQTLRGTAKRFVPRAYIYYTGKDSLAQVLEQVAFYGYSQLPWDIVLCFADGSGQLESWLEVIERIVRQSGAQMDALQITNEPNLSLPGRPVPPNLLQALIEGVITAKAIASEVAPQLQVGFNAVPNKHGQRDFWEKLRTAGGQEFVRALDYVGLNFYPDVFGGPIAPEQLGEAVKQEVRHFRADLLAVGIPATTPIRVTEHGWATGPNRSYDRQAEVLEIVIRTLVDLREELNITYYELFDLRDADSSNENIFFQFGIVRDDYTPKPAFLTYQRLIAELSDQQEEVPESKAPTKEDISPGVGRQGHDGGRVIGNKENKRNAGRFSVLQSIVASLAINAVLPLIIYMLLKNYTAATDVWALLLCGIPPMLDSLIGIIRKGRIDLIAVIVLLGIVVSVALVFVGGSPRLLLIRESFFTAASGLAYLVSLAFSRPLHFYLARQFSTGNDARQIAWFDRLWQYRGFRHSMRLITIVWGVGLLLEAAVRSVLVFTLSIQEFMFISPLIFYGILAVIWLWTISYSKQRSKRGAATAS